MATAKNSKNPAKVNKQGFIVEYDKSPFGIDGINVLHAWPTRDGLNVVSINTFKGVTSLDVRQFYRDDARTQDKWMPTQKGVRMPLGVFGEIVADAKRIEKLLKATE